jgi:hypothetical protein
MAALFFYLLVGTGGIIFLLAVAQDELSGILTMFVDLLPRLN